jgi:hypothetical protein
MRPLCAADAHILRGCQCFILIAMRFACILPFSLFLLSAAAQTPKQASKTGADELLSNGISAQQHGDYQTAIDDYRKALAIQPGLTEAQANLGAALFGHGTIRRSNRSRPSRNGRGA